MSLFNQINEDIKTSMKNKDAFKLSVIRMVKGAMQLEVINKKRDLNDDEVIAIIAKQIKMRKDSIEEFKKASRDDLVEKTQKEVDILVTYMPEQLSEEEILKIIEEVFEIVKPTSMKDLGMIMKEISPKVKGKADMGIVNKLIKEKLNNL
jgi:uncharacterized protein YqeY